MDINYELYKVFYYVASTLSFSEASKQLFISQSAVSQSIKALEKKLDQTLFIRSTKKVRLTTEGEILLRHIEPAISLIKRGESQLLDVGARGGQLHIGASDTICRYFLVPYLERFHREFPGAHIKVTNATSIRCVELLETGQVDLIVVNSPNAYLGNVPNVKKIKDFQDVFIADKAFEELKGKKLSFKELLNYPILMLDRKSTTSEYLHNLFLQNQLDLVPEIELSSNDLLIDLARIGYVPHGIFLFNAAYFISVCSSAFQNFAIFSSIFSLLQIWKSFHSLGNTSWHCLSINRSSNSVITPLS